MHGTHIFTCVPVLSVETLTNIGSTRIPVLLPTSFVSKSNISNQAQCAVVCKQRVVPLSVGNAGFPINDQDVSASCRKVQCARMSHPASTYTS
jgi:hypothetical protein